MVELSPAGEGLLRQAFAGDTFNTAWYLRQCLAAEWSVDYLTAISRDSLGDQMTEFIARSGLGVTHIARTTGSTVGMYMISLDNGERSFSYWRAGSSATHLADDPARVAGALAGAGLIYFSGITLAILTQDRREALLRAIAVARAAGAKVAFDPNIREKLWETRATLRHWLDRAAAGSDIVLPSFDEESGVAGDATPEATLARYRALGVPMIVVKNGDGMVQAWDGASHRFEPMRQRPVDTTAAGDSFNAGFLAKLITGHDMRACLAAGAAVAAQVIGKAGALVQINGPKSAPARD